MSWQDFEALTALLVRKEWGGDVFLTPASGDHGADVVLQGAKNVLVQCKTLSRKFADSNAVREPYAALREYGQRYARSFDTAILAINAPQVDDRVRERARDLDVLIWDRADLEAMLQRHTVHYSELGNMLDAPRLTF